jgi:hypothetical protein
MLRIAIQRNVYTGVVDQHGQHVNLNHERFSHERSLNVVRHSPTGFSWGFEGSGPAQLALAILLEELTPLGFSVKGVRAYYQDFKREVIAKLAPDKPWTLTSADVARWMMAKIQRGIGDQGGHP